MDKDKHFQMRVSQEFLDLIDDWRRKQPEIPSRAQAIRRLVAQGFWFDLETSERIFRMLPKVIDRDRIDLDDMETLIDFLQKTAQTFRLIIKDAKDRRLDGEIVNQDDLDNIIEDISRSRESS